MCARATWLTQIVIILIWRVASWEEYLHLALCRLFKRLLLYCGVEHLWNFLKKI